jgi:TorA maturation chaperone TorD
MEKTLARSIMYEFLAKGFLYPDKAVFNTFTDPEFVENLKAAARLVQAEGESLEENIEQGLNSLKKKGLDEFLREYEHLFGTHSTRIRVMLNSTEIQTDEKKPFYMVQTHDLADIAGCYKAFGFEVDKIRADHFGVELEFMQLLTFKEFQAMKDGKTEKQAICVDAEKLFLVKYIGLPSRLFAKGIVEAAEKGYYKFLAETFSWFIERELTSFKIEFIEVDDADALQLVGATRSEEEDAGSEMDCETCATKN